MNCPECEEQLQRCLDDGDVLAIDVELSQHLEQCASCRALFATARRMSHGLTLMTPLDVPVGFAERVAAKVLRDQRQTTRLRWVVSAAAALLIGALAVWIAWQMNRNAQPQPSIPSGPELAKNEPAKTESPRPSLPSFQAQIERTRQVMEDTARGTRMLLSPAEQFTEARVPLDFDPPIVSMGEMTRGVSEGLEPVTDSAKRAWGMFRRLLPPGEERKKS